MLRKLGNDVENPYRCVPALALLFQHIVERTPNAPGVPDISDPVGRVQPQEKNANHGKIYR